MFSKPGPARLRAVRVKASFSTHGRAPGRRGLGAGWEASGAADVAASGQIARLMSSRMVRAAQTNNSAPSMVVAAAESRE